MDELSLEFHCVLQLQDRSRNVNGTFTFGWIILVAPGLTTRNKKLLETMASLLVARCIATRGKDATSSSWPYYQEQEATRNKGIATSSKVHRY